jgi:hypothetical protein
MLFYRLVKAVFGMMKKKQQRGGVITYRRSEGDQCLDIEAQHDATCADTQLICAPQDDIPHLEPFLGDRLMLDIGALLAV